MSENNKDKAKYNRKDKSCRRQHFKNQLADTAAAIWNIVNTIDCMHQWAHRAAEKINPKYTEAEDAPYKRKRWDPAQIPRNDGRNNTLDISGEKAQNLQQRDLRNRCHRQQRADQQK